MYLWPSGFKKLLEHFYHLTSKQYLVFAMTNPRAKVSNYNMVSQRGAVTVIWVCVIELMPDLIPCNSGHHYKDEIRSK